MAFSCAVPCPTRAPGVGRAFKWVGLNPRRGGLRATWQVKPASSRPHWVYRLRFVPIRTSSLGAVLPPFFMLCPPPPWSFVSLAILPCLALVCHTNTFFFLS